MSTRQPYIFLVICLLAISHVFISNQDTADGLILLLAQNPDIGYGSVWSFPVWLAAILNEFTGPEFLISAFMVFKVGSVLIMAYSGWRSFQNKMDIPVLLGAYVVLALFFFSPGWPETLVLLGYAKIWWLSQQKGSSLAALSSVFILAYIMSVSFIGMSVGSALIIYLVYTRFLQLNLALTTVGLFLVLISPQLLFEVLDSGYSPVLLNENQETEKVNKRLIYKDDRYLNVNDAQQWVQVYTEMIPLSHIKNEGFLRWRYWTSIQSDSEYTYWDGIQFQSINVDYKMPDQAANWDEAGFLLINQWGGIDWLRPVQWVLFICGQWGLYVFVLILLVWSRKETQQSGTEWLSYLTLVLVGALIITLMKQGVWRPRPLAGLEHLNAVIFAPFGELKAKSFPSGDAFAAFQTLTFVALIRPKWKWLLILAPFVALNRVASGVHYPMDVLAGSVLGMTLSAIIYTLFFTCQGEIQQFMYRFRLKRPG